MTPEKLDAWRIVPRLLILSYMVVFYQTCSWFMGARFAKQRAGRLC